MGAIAIQQSKNQLMFFEKLDKYFKNIEVLKDFTLFDDNDRLSLVEKGTISTIYKHCYFTFYSKETNSKILLNVIQVINNLNTYFKINYNEIK